VPLARQNGNTISVTADYHRNGSLDHRTNLYYVQTNNFGQTWTNVSGTVAIGEGTHADVFEPRNVLVWKVASVVGAARFFAGQRAAGKHLGNEREVFGVDSFIPRGIVDSCEGRGARSESGGGGFDALADFLDFRGGRRSCRDHCGRHRLYSTSHVQADREAGRGFRHRRAPAVPSNANKSPALVPWPADH